MIVPATLYFGRLMALQLKAEAHQVGKRSPALPNPETFFTLSRKVLPQDTALMPS